MVRPYAVKGKKQKNRDEKYDKQEHEEQVEVDEKEPAKRASIEKPTKEVEGNDEEEGEAGTDELVGIPIAPTDIKTNKNGVIFVLEKASLEVAKLERVSNS